MSVHGAGGGGTVEPSPGTQGRRTVIVEETVVEVRPVTVDGTLATVGGKHRLTGPIA